VEVSPPQESIRGTQWRTSYQPVSYRLDSKLGTEAEFKAMVEQCFNALYLERLNYGMQADMMTLEPALLRRFEERLPEFRASIARGHFCGNDLVFGLVDTFIRTGTLPVSGTPKVVE